MYSFFTAISRPAAQLVVAGALLAALAAPTAAHASPSPTLAVSVVEGHVSIDSLSSTTAMHVKVLRTDENTIRVADTAGGTAQTGDHCLVVQDDDTVDCDITGLTVDSVHFEGSPLGDSLSFEEGWTLPVKANGWGGNDDLAGGNGSDIFHGGDGNDTVHGGAGNDFAFGELGRDTLMGESGNDELQGSFGADRIFGGTGRDVLRGGNGADRLFAKGDAGSGSDALFGGQGFDRATLDRHIDTAKRVERRSY